MTDAELEARARRAYDVALRTTPRITQWDLLTPSERCHWRDIARAALEDPRRATQEPPADPFEEWWESTKKSGIEYLGPGAKECARAAWNAGAAHEREQHAAGEPIENDNPRHFGVQTG